MYYWGADTRPGYGLVKPHSLQTTNAGIRYLCPKSSIQDVAIGCKLVGFIRGDGNVSFIRFQGDGSAQDGKLQHLDWKTVKIKALSCGESHAVLVSYDGKVLWIDKLNVPRSLPQLCDKQVTRVACGDHHSIALTNDGHVFTWGQNSSGQLGLGKDEPSTQSPKLLSSLSGIPLVQISAGGDHSFALSLSGAVFGWGKNNAGQLGLGDNTDRDVPINVSSLNLKKIILISCGGGHTATLTKGGLVFTFGSGSYGQLGHNSLRDELRPRIVAELWSSKVSQIACGRHHTLAFIESSEKIYSFGCGEQGQLGNGQRTNQCVPLPVHLSTEHKFNRSLERICAGGNNSFALCQQMRSETGLTNAKALSDGHIVRLDDDLIDSWISECDTQTWNRIQREINNIFSSEACVNGSFLEKSCDKHFQSSVEYDGLDLSLARLAFEKLAKKKKVLSEVKKVVEHKLLPSLNPRPAGVEALRVYLILPELLRVLRKHHLGTDLTVSLASAILNLHPDWLKVLENYWSRLPDFFLENLVKTFRLQSHNFLLDMTMSGHLKWSSSLEKTLKVLQKVYEINTLTVNRKSLLGDTFQSLRKNAFKPGAPLKVKFKGEAGIDDGAVSLEFFTLIAEDILTAQPKIVEISEESGLPWFTSEDCGTTDEVYLFGVLCGMALYNNCLMNFGFPLALFKMLLGQKPTLQDLEELFPIEARTLNVLLEEDEEVVPELYLDFTVRGHEVVLNGAQIPVTKVNRQEYVDLYIDFVFHKSVKQQFENFSRGFSQGCPIDAWKVFLPEELMAVLYGNTEYKWAQLKENVTYENFTPTEEVIQNFWEVFFELTEDQKKLFLKFVFGTHLLPVGGLSKMGLRICKWVLPDPDEHHPVGQTCFRILRLPNYSNVTSLRDKLINAITHCNEFGME
ncbi:probable E3 ubiquitin-protein ligase HERC4 [Chanos chanos]|uniref:Probable E3 ubiquitin-protein ligase HERC4 n=1 Tax=Chanos chanos TaxID=29144 RepID=A0A6J2WKE0_CHACN|nr:probable E3 ubiquitin-protein ligase HERC4 [Chanos chanos]